MRVLLVEDDETFLGELTENLAAIVGIEIFVARGKDSAIASLKAHFFDLAILDLNLPTQGGAMDIAVAHGEDVFAQLQAECPGTPVIFLTGSSPEAVYTAALEHKRSEDLWGDGGVHTVHLFAKSKVVDAVTLVQKYAARLAGTASIELARAGAAIQLSEEHERALRIFARRYDGLVALLEPIKGGLSGAPVLRFTVRGREGGVRLNGISKLCDAEEARDEETRYRNVPRLKQGDYAPLLSIVSTGLKGQGATLYRLADGFDRSFYDVLAKSEDDAEGVVSALQATFAPWYSAKKVVSVSLEDVRRAFLSDAEYSRITKEIGIGDADFSGRQINAQISCTHGDLHGQNILVDGANRPTLIDFGRVRDGSCCVDPITLELSLLSHPAARELTKGWKPDPQHPWRETERYADATPFPKLVRRLRRWAHEVAIGDDEVHANAFAYCMRQLKYQESDRDTFARLGAEMLSYLAK